MPLPPRYAIYPTAIWSLDIPPKLKWTYIVLYALAWNHDYRYVTESLAELAEILSGMGTKRFTFNTVRRHMKSLAVYGLIRRERVGLRYRTILLLRHDEPIPELPKISIEDEFELDLARGRTSRVSVVDKFAYSVLDDLDCDYEAQYSPEGCPFWFDICFPQVDLLVELDSSYWHEKEDAAERDSRKSAWAEDHGYQLIRIQIGDLRDESERIRLQKQLTELVQDQLGLDAEQRGGKYVTPLQPDAEQRGGKYVTPLQRAAPINNNNIVVVETDLDDQPVDQQQQLFNKAGDVERNEQLLASMGVVGGPRYRLAREIWVTSEYLEAIMAYRAEQAAKGNVLGPGWVVKFVGERGQLPDGEPDRYRYIRGKYKDYVKR